ncbi:hypothetical protein TSTA_051870 [Talaromyces stipitatus ATCC 10500]|uniref:Peptidase A2 domain-containing protein n=1 Tax=Talaromyces stipitatus (strain ATCC 10500 / CBS 375.48 / QM 6759 / NRRL 1006) TaxID=441959 RepID=B8MJQ1_TALSN|nr:uncharacterized protein TSTA_051870 [Talaromyces stipitatus ATCC 10500]EED15750.1 hypothetical protein TSTA_051870 [Talaromyces stipitatus ATCC 10500]
MGLLIDTGAAEILTAGYAQYLAYRKVAKNITIDTLTTRAASIRFSAGEPLQSLDSIDIKTPISTVQFHIVKAMTPFLLCIKDLDHLKVYYNNTKNLLVRNEPPLTKTNAFSQPPNYVIYTADLDILLLDNYIKPYYAQATIRIPK